MASEVRVSEEAAVPNFGGDDIKRVHNTAFFVFGRFQPPTRGHELLFKELATKAADAHADAYVFVSSTQDNKTNPLSVEQKIKYIREMFPRERRIKFINTTEKKCTTPPKAATALVTAGYTHLEMFAGSDRVDGFRAMATTDMAKNVPKMKIHEVHELERDPDAEGATAESGTKVREAAVRGDIERVRSGLPNSTVGTDIAERLSANIVSGLAKPKSSAKSRKARSRSRSRSKEGFSGGYRRTRRATKKLKLRKRSY